MSKILKKISSSFLKVLCLGGLSLLVAAPAPAQEQTPKSQAPPPASSPRTGVKPKMAPRRAPAPAPVPDEYKASEEGFRGKPEKSLERKSVTGKAGGEEIRSKKGQDEE